MNFDKSQSLDSSVMHKVEYSTEGETIRIHYKSGGYSDYDCSLEHYNELCKAESAGRYLHTFIKPTKKITPRSNTMTR